MPKSNNKRKNKKAQNRKVTKLRQAKLGRGAARLAGPERLRGASAG